MKTILKLLLLLLSVWESIYNDKYKLWGWKEKEISESKIKLLLNK